MTQSVSKGNRYSVVGERIRLPLKTLHENIPLQHSIFHCLALCFSMDFWDRLFFMSSTTALAVPLYLPRMLPSESLISYTVISYIFAGDALKFWSFFPRFNWEGTRRNNSLNGTFQANIRRFPQNQSERRVKGSALHTGVSPSLWDRTGSYCNECDQKMTAASTFYLNICEHVNHDPNLKAQYLTLTENW